MLDRKRTHWPTRLMAAFLAFVMLLGNVPVSVFATEIPGEEVAETTAPVIDQTEPTVNVAEPENETAEELAAETVDVYVNPLYADVITEEMVRDNAQQIPAVMTFREPEYVSYANALELLREQLTLRAESTTLYIRSETRLSSSYYVDLFHSAMEHTGNPKQGDYLHCNMGGCEFLNLTEQTEDGVYYYTATFCPVWFTTAEMEAEMDAAVDSLLTQLNLWDKSDYRKIRGVYDYICGNIKYDYDTLDDDSYKLKYTAYAALVNKTAVCQGFASLFYRLMLELGVDCRYISGWAGDENHGWNIVRLDDVYYNVDVTWDAGITVYYRYFLCTPENFPDHARSSEFTSADFMSRYPMATMPYVVNVQASGTLNNGMKWVLDGDTGILTVSGTGAMPNWGSLDAPWYPYAESIRGAVLTEGITSVGDSAFHRCKNMTSVQLPSTLTRIGEYGFDNCRSLKQIELPEGLRTIDAHSFSECTALREIVIPSTVTTFGSSVFSNCYYLTKVTFAEGMKSIPSSMFFNSDSLKSVVFPSTLTEIGNTAFRMCDALTEVTLPASLVRLGTAAFADCTKLKNIYVEDGNTNFMSKNGVLFSKDGKTLWCFPAARTGTYTIPDGTVTIANAAFGSARISNVIFPDSVKTIDTYGFARSWLREVVVGEGVEYVGDTAFGLCDYLTKVTFGKALREIDSAFSYYRGSVLREVVFTGDAPRFDSYTFYTTTVTAYYPSNNPTWTSSVRQNYRGTVTWKGMHVCAYDAVVTAPTCTEQGYTTHTCTCGDSYVDSYTAPLGHSYEAVVTAPTCTEQGYTTHTCECGDSYVDSYVDRIGHSYQGLVCGVCGKAIQPIAGDDELCVTITPENYWTVSNVDTEKLACGPGLVTYGDGNFAVAYLADDTNTVETESSGTIVCRIGLFNIKDPEYGKFLDIATAGQTIGDVTIGSKAPYEPNLIKIDDSTLLILFNIRTTGGKYIYYSATFDTTTNTVVSYQNLTLDGKEWTPANIAASYNAIAENTIDASGPTGSMVFTSQIIQHEGYYYGYCGGISNGFSGMLVRSVDGIHWTAVLAPETANDMKGVIECGFQFLNDSVYFCMRDISSGVYHCSYNFSTGAQLMNTEKLSGLTTSKPAAFIQDGKMYLIVNQYTGDDNTVGRRNTAQIYRVDPETCGLTLMKQVFCKDGCAYHTVVEYGGINYWCFHTDARRINPYTQGRSNLALLPIPNLVETGSENGELNFNAFASCYTRGCITGSGNVWQGGAVNMHYQIPLAAFVDYDAVTITANADNKCYVAFFTQKMTTQTQIAYAEGWAEQLIMEPGTSQTLPIPGDAQYLYILATNAAGNDLLPKSVVFHNHIYVAVVTAPTCTEQGYTTHTCECGDSYVDSYVDATGHTYENGICTGCGKSELCEAAYPVDFFVFAGQSNMMGAAVLEPEVDRFTNQAWEYKYMPKLRGMETGFFVSARNPAGEWHYIDMDAAYGDQLSDLSYQSSLSNYSANTYFCPAMRDGTKGFSAQSEADTYPGASLAPYFVTEYAEYGHSSVYAHMAKGAVKIDHYFTEEMATRYNALISEYNTQNNKSYSTLTLAGLSGAGDAFDNKYNAMLEDYAALAPNSAVENKCFVWLQGEGDAGRSYIEYKLKMQVLWEHLQDLGFTHFLVLRVGYWGSTGILNVIKAQEDFCAENENCHIVTRAPSLVPHPGATTDNWWISEPSAEYDNCRDSYLVDSNNNHFNEKAMQIFAERSAENVHRILHLGLEPVLEEENIRGMQKEEELPEDDTPYTSYVGTEVFRNKISISKVGGTWKEQQYNTASTDLIPVNSDDSVWIQYVFFKSDAHAVGGFYDADGQLVAPLWYEDFGFTADPNTGGVTAFRTPVKTNRVSVADLEAATGKKIAYVRFTAWAASAGGHAGTEARIYHEEHTHRYDSAVTAPTCTEQGYTTHTCKCGDSFVDSYVDATGHTYENGICTTCGKKDSSVELFEGFSGIDFFLKDGILADGEEHVVAIYSNTNNARMAVIHLKDGATYRIRVSNNGGAATKRMKICTFTERFSELMIAPLASERNMGKLDPSVVSVVQDVIFWDPNIGENCVSTYEGTFVNTGNAKTMIVFAAWGADPSLVEVSVKSEDHLLNSDTDAGGNNLKELTGILTSNMGLENEATQKIMEIAKGFWEHRDEFIYCSGTALDQPWNYWSYTGYVDSANTGKTITAENAGFKRIDCSTFVRYVINGIDYYSTPYYNALEHAQVEQGGLDAGIEVDSKDPTVCRTGKIDIRPGKKLILEAKNSNYAFTKVFGYNASGEVIQTLEATAANAGFMPKEGVEYLRAEMKVTAASDYAPGSAGVPAAILKCLRIREDERLEINAECPLDGYRNANQMCKWFDENGYAVEFDKETFNVDDLRVGSVIFWGRTSGTWAYKNITHTSLYIGDGYILHVSAPYGLMGGEGILIEPIEKLMARYDIPLAAISSPQYHTAVDSHIHTYESLITPPTCTEQGYTTHTCECGDEYVDSYVDALGQNYEGVYCVRCGEKNPDLTDCPENPVSTEWPRVNTDLSHIICYGQSFSVGSDAPLYADPAVDGVYVYGSLTNSSNGKSLSPIPTTGNQHAIISAGNVLARLLAEGGYNTDLVLGSYGSGGRTIAQLMSKERQQQIKAEEGYTYDCLSSGRYEVFETSVDALAEFADNSGQSISCPVIVYLQGETDQNTDAQLGYPDNPNRAGYGAGGDKEKYKQYMTWLKEDMQSKVMEAYGQTEKPLFVIYQVSGTYVRTQYSSINMAQIEFAQENEDVILVQTPYFTSHYTGTHHLSQNGYRWLGEYIGRYVHTALTQRVKPWPMLPEKFEILSENTIRIRVSGAENGLSIDTYTVENATNSKNRYGFNILVDGTNVVPKTVEVSGSEIILTMPDGAASLLDAQTVYVQYAGQKAQGTGNIRDNCTEVGFYEYLDDRNDIGTDKKQSVSHSSLDEDGNSIIGKKYPLYNWLASFSYRVNTNDLHVHNYVETVIAPTCSTRGYTAYACACGDAYAGEFVDATGIHTYEAVVTAPNCTESGYTTYICTCGDVREITDHTDPLGHKEVVDARVLPTAGKAGLTEGSHCAACGEILKAQEVIPATGYEKALEDGAFKVLLVGNTFSEDAANYGYGMTNSQLLGILQGMLGEEVQVTVGLIHYSASSLAWHATQAHQNTSRYAFRVIDSEKGKWETVGTVSSAAALQWADWDAVVLQPFSVEAISGKANPIHADQEDAQFYPLENSTSYMLDHVNRYAPDAEIYCFMHWQRYNLIKLNVGLSQHNTMADFFPVVMDYRGSESGARYDEIIPVGTAVQNARTTYLSLLSYHTDGKVTLKEDPQFGLQRDVNHLSLNVGRYIAALTFAETLIPEEIRAEGYAIPDIRNTESVGRLPKEYTTLGQKAAQAAVNSWKNNSSLAVTEIEGYREDPTVAAAEKLAAVTLEIPCALDVADLQSRIAAAALEELPEDFNVDAVAFAEGFVLNAEGQNFTATVTIRFGYTGKAVAVGVTVGGHDYEAVVTKPTCTERGFTTHTCHCGDNYVDSYVDATGHEFGDWTVTSEPNCTEKGMERRDCANCDHFETREVEAIGHDYEAVVTEPTCIEKGYTAHTCHCGDSYIDSYVDATGHKFGDWTVTTEPTCTKIGEERRDCENCDHFETIEVDAIGHDYEAVVTAPTCTEKGFTTHTCSKCGDSYVDSYVNALGHEYGEWYVTKQATLEEEGEERRDCDRCDDFQTRKIPKLVHNYTSVVTAPTCTEQGYTTHTCQNCGDKYVDTYVNALGHSFADYVSNGDATCTSDGTKTAECERCDETDTIRDVGTAKGHSFGDWAVVDEPTCTEKGMERRDCENCDHYETREVVATGHDYEAVVTKPTCTEKGYTTHTCHCGDSYTDSYVDAVGHKFGDWEIVEEPTCTEKGEERRDCDNCDHFETREVEAIGHDYETVATKPTCTEKGYTTHACHCGDSYVDSYVDATGHKFGVWTVTTEPTCTEKGEERRNCANCDHLETREVDAMGHDYETVATKPTCTEKGYTTHTCHCGDSYVDSYVNALGHEYGEWYVTKQATLESEGEERRDCDRCDDFQTRKIPKLVHNYISVVTEPTCTEQGYTTHTCQNCGDKYVDTYVNALGHSFVDYVSNDDATCTVDGTKTAECERCDATDMIRDVGTAKGHKFGDWTVTTEPTCTKIGEERRDCEKCDHSETRKVAAAGHDYEAIVTAPTCVDKGFTTHTCHCGDSYTDSYVDAVGHKFGEWTVTTEPSCTEKGEERRDCANCDHFETREIAATGHDYDAVITNPTCIDKGFTTHTCHCGDSYTDSYVDAVGHKFGEWTLTTEPTCTEKGEERRDCDNCDHYETRELEATGHDYDAVITNPTCTDKGFTTHTCHCGDSYIDSYVDATGHKFGEWEVVNETTCTEKGAERRDCENCDHFETREVAATGHDYEAVVTNPTCTDKGFTTHTCHCGDSYADRYVNALGHKYENGSCTVCGEPEVKYLPGDVDLDGDVDVDDVLALLWYVLFPDDYPIEVDADFDHNGSTDVDDVLTLLWYVLFPEDYPLN